MVRKPILLTDIVDILAQNHILRPQIAVADVTVPEFTERGVFVSRNKPVNHLGVNWRVL